MFPPDRKPAEVEALRMAATRYGGAGGRVFYLAWHLAGWEEHMVGIIFFTLDVSKS